MTPHVCGLGGLGALNALGRFVLVLVKHGLGAVMLIMYGRRRRPFCRVVDLSRDGLIRGYLTEAVFAIAAGLRLSQGRARSVEPLCSKSTVCEQVRRHAPQNVHKIGTLFLHMFTCKMHVIEHQRTPTNEGGGSKWQFSDTAG